MIAPTYPLNSRRKRLRALDASTGPTAVSASTTYTSGSPTVTVVSATGLKVGMVIALAATEFPLGTTILTIVGTTLTMSNNALASAGPVAVLFVDSSPSTLNGLTMRLYTATAGISVNSTIASFTEATFDGYAGIPLVLTLGYVDGTGLPIAQSQLVSWLMTGILTPNVVLGYWVDDGTDVVIAAPFDAPIPMAALDAELAGVLQDSYPTGKGFVQVTPAP